jgi:hypothetical protein
MKTNSTLKPKCYNCKFGGDKFKIAGKTYLHCGNKELYPEKDFEEFKISPWDTLREFSDKCNKHQFKSL